MAVFFLREDQQTVRIARRDSGIFTTAAAEAILH